VSARWAVWPPPSRPRRVEGGIKARSRRGAIGEQWWSRRFIAVLESQGMSGRLARGRSYARAGQVLDFKLSQGKVTAQVQGSRVRPYQVRIGVLPLTAAQWRVVQDRLAGQALFRAKLLAGEMPPRSRRRTGPAAGQVPGRVLVAGAEPGSAARAGHRSRSGPRPACCCGCSRRHGSRSGKRPSQGAGSRLPAARRRRPGWRILRPSYSTVSPPGRNTAVDDRRRGIASGGALSVGAPS
jgi:hypothetical protein